MNASEALELITNDLVQVTEPDPDELAEAVKKAVGTTPLREFGAKAGQSASTLSRLMNGKLTKPLTAETLLNIAASSNIEDTASLLRELARANGMMSRSEQQALRQHMSLRRERDEFHGSMKRVMSTVILARLAERGVSLREEGDGRTLDVAGGFIKNVSEDGIRYDFKLDVDSAASKYTWVLWAFPQAEEDYSDGSFNPRRLSNLLMRELSPVFLADQWTPTLYEGAKLSFCFVDWQLFECFCHLLSGARLNNRFSAILIDQDALSIKEERVFPSIAFPDCASMFDLPPIMSITQDIDDVAEELTGDDFLIFEEDGEA